MKNRASDLNNHMFAMLEKLSDDELTGDDLADECRRASAMASIGKVIVENARTALEAQKLVQDKEIRLPDFLEDRTVQKVPEDHPKFLLRRDA